YRIQREQKKNYKTIMQLLELIAILCILTCIWGQPCDVVRWTGCKGPKPKPNTNTANVLHSKLKGLGMMPSQVRDHAQDYDEEEDNQDAERKTNQKKILRIFNDIIPSRLSKELKERSDDLEDLDVAAKRQEEDEKKNEAHHDGDDNLFDNVDYDHAVIEESKGTKEPNSIQNDDSAIS
uniref:Uncharacterized protein n=1 Tax=Clytia hemisphaerica TaxID=252671 RepID=A0A7M5UVM6_9CNID